MEKTIDYTQSDRTPVINKSSVTTILSLSLVLAGLYSPLFSKEIINMGLFATSGAVTNWLAIHMLFEKVPLLYGSGVIPLRFKAFKAGIKTMMMNQFFTSENIQKFLTNDSSSTDSKMFDHKKLVSLIDHNHFFNKLIETVNESQLGSMLMMFGGPAALEPLRYPFAQKMEAALIETMEQPEFRSKLQETISSGDGTNNIQEQVENIVEKRLDELTPQMVKEIIQKMIRDHLGWLVVWGGVFGALIGLVCTVISH